MRVEVLDVLAQHDVEMAWSGDQKVVEAFAAQRADPAPGDRVGPRRLDWRADDADVGAGEHRVEDGGELAVPVADQEAELPGAVAIWFPLNYLVTASLERYHRFFGDDLTIEYPTGSGNRLTLDAVADDLWARLVSIFLVGPDGRRPCFGWVDRLQNDPNWKDNLVFSEYFHGDNAAGLGAAHQTGWTGIVADVIRRRHGAVRSIGDVIRTLGEPPSTGGQGR